MSLTVTPTSLSAIPTGCSWLQLAAAFGWHGHRVNNSRDLESTLRGALDEKGPSLVTLPIDYRENVLLTKRLGELMNPGDNA